MGGEVPQEGKGNGKYQREEGRKNKEGTEGNSERKIGGLSLGMQTQLRAAWPMRALAGGWQGWVSWDFQPSFQARCAPRPSVVA